MPATLNRVDFAAYDKRGEVVLLARTTSRLGTSPDWAAEFRRNILTHGDLPKASYFLIVTPDRIYVWKQDEPIAPDAVPEDVFDGAEVLGPYFQRFHLQPSEIAPRAFEFLVDAWLTEIAWGAWLGKSSADPVTLSGVGDSLRGARVEMTSAR